MDVPEGGIPKRLDVASASAGAVQGCSKTVDCDLVNDGMLGSCGSPAFLLLPSSDQLTPAHQASFIQARLGEYTLNPKP